MTYPARGLGISEQGLRKRMEEGRGSLRQLGAMTNLVRLLFRLSDVFAPAVEEKALHAQD